MPQVVEKLTGEPLSIDQLIEYLPAFKEVLTQLPEKRVREWSEGAVVLHRYRKGEIVCEEGDFGSTAFFIVSGSVDIFIHNPLSHLRTRPVVGIFGRSMARMKSFLTDDETTTPRAGLGARQFIGIDATVALPMSHVSAALGHCASARAVRDDRDVARDPGHARGQPAGVGCYQGNFESEDAHVQGHFIQNRAGQKIP